MPNIVLQLIIVSGIILLLSALVPIKRICAMLPSGATRTTWVCLGSLICLSSAGYLLFLWINSQEGPDHHEDWLVSLVFLSAATVVFIVCLLSHSTAKDVSRIASLERAATIDPVTELFNRRHITSLLAKECTRSAHDKSPLSILLIDIDRFKKINDTYGHQTGDYVLKELATLIASVEWPLRTVGRYGGEEFLVVLPNTSASQAAQVAECVRSTAESASIALNGEQIVSPTVSIGVSTAYGWQESPGDLVAIADEALYTAKTTGRNRVCHGVEKTRQTGSQLAIVCGAPASQEVVLTLSARAK
jgi:diguanylate cyclase (GGDEF)-like protein